MKITRLGARNIGAFGVALSLIAQSGLAAAQPEIRASNSATVSAARPIGARAGAPVGKSGESQLAGGTLIIGLISTALSIGLVALISHHDKGSSN